MEPTRPLYLQFGAEVTPKVKARIEYAFRVFAAIYDHAIADSDKEALLCYYAKSDDRKKKNGVFLPARYAERSAEQRIEAPQFVAHGGESIPLFHGRDPGGLPDWLGEIFEWISCSDERGVVERDSVGRIPYAQTVFARHGVSPRKPYAAILMAWLEDAVRGNANSGTLPRAPSPFPNTDHAVICSHDIDYYFAGKKGALHRIVKNIGIGILATRDAAFVRDNGLSLIRLLLGRKVGDFFPSLEKASAQRPFKSTCFVISQGEHRRDANYEVTQIASRLNEIQRAGFSLGLHGSYCSIVENNDLTGEVKSLAAVAGKPPRGTRQHWLRFDSLDKLFGNVEKAGFLYDSTLGFSEGAGFRNGASFAFPPYDFAHERAYPFLEIPLVLMDSALASGTASPSEARALTQSILAESRRWGWGGVSILWHNPIEPLNVAKEINDIFWAELDGTRQHRESWISGDDFMDQSLKRYQQVGLLSQVAYASA